MDFLNNLNVVISIIVGLFGIGGYFVGTVAYFRHKVTSSQQKQTIQLQSSLKRSSYQAMSNPLSKWDWMEVLWLGFEDCFRACLKRSGSGQSTEHQASHGNVDHRFAALGQPFIVQTEPSTLREPGQSAFHHPAPGQDDKAFLLIRT